MRGASEKWLETSFEALNLRWVSTAGKIIRIYLSENSDFFSNYSYYILSVLDITIKSQLQP